jgi:hypothetical protein
MFVDGESVGDSVCLSMVESFRQAGASTSPHYFPPFHIKLSTASIVTEANTSYSTLYGTIAADNGGHEW